jgi:hypothetical protein
MKTGKITNPEAFPDNATKIAHPWSPFRGLETSFGLCFLSAPVKKYESETKNANRSFCKSIHSWSSRKAEHATASRTAENTRL